VKEKDMKTTHVTTVDELTEGQILLIGGFFYRVAQVTRTGFTGCVWREEQERWEEISYTVPIPHPAHVVHVLPVDSYDMFEEI
jgi:hypothetical protein